MLLFTGSYSSHKGAESRDGEENTQTTLCYNGDILTMDGDEPNYVEAIVVKDVKIAFVGSEAEKKEYIQMVEQRHPMAIELDEISTEYPVLVIHQSGHLAVINHKALEMSGYTSETPNPKGGVIQRLVNSQEPNGVLEEVAFFQPVFRIFASSDQEANERLAFAGKDTYVRFLSTTQSLTSFATSAFFNHRSVQSYRWWMGARTRHL